MFNWFTQAVSQFMHKTTKLFLITQAISQFNQSLSRTLTRGYAAGSVLYDFEIQAAAAEFLRQARSRTDEQAADAGQQ